MDELFKWLSANATAYHVVIAAFMIFVIVFVIAFFQGRAVSLWPPKIGARPEKPNARSFEKRAKATIQEKKLLQKVCVDYSDSPSEHGWQILESTTETQPSFKHIVDGYVGKALEIRSTTRYAMDYYVTVEAQLATDIEFIAKLTANSVFYVQVAVQSKDGSQKRNVWLAFLAGSDQPRPLGDGTFEWTIFMTPIRLEGDWSVFHVDLRETVKSSFGKDGWIYKHLNCFRIRGNIAIAQISVRQQ